MKRFILALVVSLSVVGTSCSSIPLKQKATIGLQAAHVAVAAAQDTERAFYAAKTAGLTAQVHGQFAVFFERYFTQEEKAAIVLLAWRAGDPAPTSVADAMRALREALTTADAITDGAAKSSLAGKINDGIAQVRGVLAAVGGA